MFFPYLTKIVTLPFPCITNEVNDCINEYLGNDGFGVDRTVRVYCKVVTEPFTAEEKEIIGDDKFPY